MLLAENRNRSQRYGGTFRMGPVCAVGHFLSYLKHFGGFLTQRLTKKILHFVQNDSPVSF